MAIGNRRKLLEVICVSAIISIALFVGFYNPEELSHPLHADLLQTVNAIYNIHNNIPYEVNGKFQWISEHGRYFDVNFLFFYFCSLFWNNTKGWLQNLLLPHMLIVIAVYLSVYFFTRKYYGAKVGLIAILFMALSTHWYNYPVRLFAGAWAALPGISFILYWLYLKFSETGRFKFLFWLGLLFGLSFYFTTWPVLVIVVPSLMVFLLLPSSRNPIKKRFLGLCLIAAIITLVILAKEMMFIATGLRYKTDPSGLTIFINTFFTGRFYNDGYSGHFSLIILLQQAGLHFKELTQALFYPGAQCTAEHPCFDKPTFTTMPLLSYLVILTAIAGLALMFKRQKHSVNFFLSGYFCFVALLITITFHPFGRYFLSIWPIPYIASGYFIVNTYAAIKHNVIKKRVFLSSIAAGLLLNIYQTYYYMHKILPIYGDFKYSCYDSIEWPLPELKEALKGKNTVYDIIVVPNVDRAYISYLRIWPDYVHLEKESYAKLILPYQDLWKTLDKALKEFPSLKVLIIANNFNQLLNDEICPACSKERVAYDKSAFTTEGIKTLFPYAKLIRYVGNIHYPSLLAIFEINPDESIRAALIGNSWFFRNYEGLRYDRDIAW